MIAGVPCLTERVERMFLGRDLNKLDDKYRLTVPARYREELSEGAYILQGFTTYLMVFTPQVFEKMARQVNETSITDEDARLLRHMIFGSAEWVKLDSNGRILIPEFLRNHAEIKSEVYLVGSGTFFEIWSPDRWQIQDALLKDPVANSKRFASHGLSTNI